MKTATVEQRWLIRRDYPQALVCLDDWTEEQLKQSQQDTNTIGRVAEVGDQVVGVMIYRLREESVEILKLGVLEEWRRRGVGTQLVECIKTKIANYERRKLCNLVVDADNLGTHLFLKACGFKACVYDRDHYEFYFGTLPEAEPVGGGVNRVEGILAEDYTEDEEE